MNSYKSILSAWHRLEYFSPSKIPSLIAKNVYEVTAENQFWNKETKSKNHKNKVIYNVYIGLIDIHEIVDYLTKKMDSTSKIENKITGTTCKATLQLDEKGSYIEGSFTLTSLTWAIGQVYDKKFNYDKWNDDFKKAEEKLIKDILLSFKDQYVDDNNQFGNTSTKVTFEHLENFQYKINREIKFNNIGKTVIEKLEIPIKQEVTKPSMNSFYINDLELLCSKTKEINPNSAFAQYLNGCLDKKIDRTDVIKEIKVIKEVIHPSNIPDGAWPSEYKLSLMQQYAVNTIFNKLSDDQGLLSVNGPPGTGKTTLLRDIIAPIIVKRAKAMVKYSNPSEAFTKTGEMAIGEKSFSIYAPDNQICQAGMLIASSNNGAVENISKELPLIKEVFDHYQNDIHFFRKIATDDKWGIFSATLGKRKNISNFINDTWNDNLFKHLDEKTITVGWEEAQKQFNACLEKVQKEKQRLSIIVDDYHKYVFAKDKLDKNKAILIHNQEDLETITNEITKEQARILLLEESISRLTEEIKINKSTEPSLISKLLFGTNKDYQVNINKLRSKLRDENNNLQKAYKRRLELQNYKNRILNEIQQRKKLIHEFPIIESHISVHRQELGKSFADEEFWNNIETKESQESCPWYSDKLKVLQSELFIAALQLNESFVEYANKKSKLIQTTLYAFFKQLSRDGKIKISDNNTKNAIHGMWHTFFLICPVASTTFASAYNMLKDLDQESIPWLFIDEAGQAVPQAGAGTIWRSKRVAVVGDPLQIEPVVQTPPELIDKILTYFQLTEKNIAPYLSIQSMTDRSNPFGTYIDEEQQQWLGMPLRVHRRCINPMFDIANNIAYANSMFCSTRQPKSYTINMETAFIHCEGSLSGKHYVQEQADIILEILKKEVENNNDISNIYIISPFSEVKNKLQKFLCDSLNNINWEDKKYKDIYEWKNKNIGTVHAFQGKQADGVILCLGLDEKSKGSAGFASKKPNLLNVALTRAKHKFVAIGDQNIWLKQPYFKELRKLNTQ